MGTLRAGAFEDSVEGAAFWAAVGVTGGAERLIFPSVGAAVASSNDASECVSPTGVYPSIASDDPGLVVNGLTTVELAPKTCSFMVEWSYVQALM